MSVHLHHHHHHPSSFPVSSLLFSLSNQQPLYVESSLYTRRGQRQRHTGRRFPVPGVSVTWVLPGGRVLAYLLLFLLSTIPSTDPSCTRGDYYAQDSCRRPVSFSSGVPCHRMEDLGLSPPPPACKTEGCFNNTSSAGGGTPTEKLTYCTNCFSNVFESTFNLNNGKGPRSPPKVKVSESRTYLASWSSVDSNCILSCHVRMDFLITWLSW